MFGRLRKVCCVWSALSLLAVSTFGQESAKAPRSPLSLELKQLTLAPRSEGPVLVGLMLDPHVRTPLEGTLELEFYDSGTRVLALHVPDIFMQGNRYETTLVLPPIPPVYSRALDMNAVFATKTDRYLLSDRTASTNETAGTLLITPSHQRGLTIGMVCGRRPPERSPNQKFASKHLSFDTYVKPPSDSYETVDTQVRRIRNQIPATGTVCSSWTIEADQLPANPLAMCAFNVILLSDGGLSALTTQQIDALKQWVRAGGSICVCTDGDLERRHSAFLTDLCSESEDDLSLAINANGKMVGIDEDEIIGTPYGLGAVVIFGPTADLAATHLQRIADYRQEQNRVVAEFKRDTNASEPLSDSNRRQLVNVLSAWRRNDGRNLYKDSRGDQQKIEQIAGFLWHVRSARIGTGGWLMRARNDAWSNSNLGVAPAETHTQSLVSQLMPTGVTMVPITYVGGILLTYIFLVGPGDYFLLGLLKMRRYTWIVFPVVTVLFTGGLVLLSNYYMSTTETGGSIEICDVAGEKIARRTRVSLEFYGSRRETESQWENSLFAPIEFQQQDDLTIASRWRNPPTRRTRQSNEDDNFYYLGRVGSKYSTHRVVPQWDPRLSRSFEIVADEAAPNCGFDWKSPGDLATVQGRYLLGEGVRAWKSDAGCIVYNQAARYQVREPPAASQSASTYNDVVYRASMTDQSDWQRMLRYGFAAKISRMEQGFLHYVRQVAPHGGSSLEDLALIDTTDPTLWVVEVTWMEGNKQLVYRQRYRIDIEAKE